MPIRRNENMVMMRSEPMAYRAAYDASNNVEYEGWADPGASVADAVWIICKNTYNASNLLTETKWAQTSGKTIADFDQIWSNYATLTYV